MKNSKVKPVHEISVDINQFLYEKDKGESLTALVVSLAMSVKRYSKSYAEYLEKRKEAVDRLLDLTNLNEREFREQLHILTQCKEAA